MTFKISEKFQVLRFQAQALKETGDFDRALLALNQALVLDHKHAATISQKGELLYEERIFLSLSSKFPSINHQREGNKKFLKRQENLNNHCESSKNVRLLNLGT